MIVFEVVATEKIECYNKNTNTSKSKKINDNPIQ